MAGTIRRGLEPDRHHSQKLPPSGRQLIEELSDSGFGFEHAVVEAFTEIARRVEEPQIPWRTVIELHR